MSSLRRLVSLFDAEVILEINLQAPQSQNQQLQALSEADIDLLTIAGGAQEGASRALRGAIENTRLFYHLMPKPIQPQIVYAGNQILADYARIEIEAGDDFHLAPNLQNHTGVEDLSVAWKVMLRAYERVRLQQYPQLQDLQAQLKVPLLPAGFAMGRLARFIARLSTTDKSVLLVDQSVAKTTLVLADNKQLMCVGKAHHVDELSIQKTRDYCSQALSVNEVATYLHNKTLFPEHLGLTISDFAIEQAWSRANVWQALGAMKAIYPTLRYDAMAGFSEACDPIILSGSRFTEHLKSHQILSIALDSILPHGISTIAVDENHMLRALGTLAESEPLLVVQMLELESFRNLASVVGIENHNYEDQVLLELEIETKDEENRSYYRVDRGQLCKIDTAGGDGVRVYLAPTRSSDVGMGMVGLGGWISVQQTEQGLLV
ncbi:MAG TPA: glutamate mutase L, partial [Anaerolineaceae bacterium]|nr:glutamate mutase L [Anaerolineaceae bacterium]